MAYSTINKPTSHFNIITYTGDGTSPKARTGVGFQPDLCWSKTRNAGTSNQLIDSVRGVTKTIVSNSSGAEGSSFSNGFLQSFDSDGFTSVAGSSATTNWNGSSTNYVVWNWKGGGTASSNSDGSVTSSVSANATAGFSIVKWSSTTNATDTVGHGLSSAPELIHTKNLASADWASHTSGIDGSWDYFRINTTAAGGNSSHTAATNSVFSFNQGSVANFISYCYHSVKGYSKVGQFSSNGNDSGSFVYTGFKPALVMIKPNVTDAWSNWYVFDNQRDHVQLNDGPLYWNLSTQEGYYGGTPASNYAQIDLLSTGFKIRRDGNWGAGGSGQQCLYYAVAAQPLVGTNDIAATAF